MKKDLTLIDDVLTETKSKPVIEVDKQNLLNDTDLEYMDIDYEEPLSLIERKIAELKVKALSPEKIALELELPILQVKRVLNSKKVKGYISEITKGIKEGLKDEMVAIYTKTIQDKIKEIERDLEGDFAKATNKDLPDLIKGLDDILKEEERKKLGATQNVFVNILNQVTK